jgi:hypothetical protein
MHSVGYPLPLRNFQVQDKYRPAVARAKAAPQQTPLTMSSLALDAQAIADAYTPPHTGKPSTIADDAKVQILLEAVQDGCYIETAAKLAGIAKATLYNWTKRGKDGEQPFAAFLDALEKAEARAEADAIRNIRQAGKLPQFWAAEMTYLERRHPEKWGRRQEGDSGPKVVVQIGVGAGSVQGLSIATFASPVSTVSEDLHRLSGDVESDNTSLCQPAALEAETTQGVSEPRQIAAGEPPRGPQGGEAAAGVPARVPSGQRRVGRLGRKKGA